MAALIDRDRLVCIGRVQEAHGLKGEMKVASITDDPDYYLDCRKVIVDGGKGLLACEIRSVRLHHAGWIMSLAGIEDRETAQAYKGAEVLLDESDVKPLAEGEYFMDDLVGCQVIGPQGQTLGEVTGVIETGANDVLTVATGEGETLVPMTEEVIREINTGARRIRIEPLPGLFGGA